MIKRIPIITIAIVLIGMGMVYAQMTPWLCWTFLPKKQMDEIVGEASGETAWQTIKETGGYNKDRLSLEYDTLFYEAKYVFDQLNQYGIPGAEIVRYPGGEVWDAVKGELWEIEPKRQKIASYQDITAMLVRGSRSANVKAELVWIGRGTEEQINKKDIAGKIVVTDGSVGSVHRRACLENDAVGVIAISQSRPYFDPLQIPWRGIRGSEDKEAKFAFYLPVREGNYLKERLLRDITTKVHAQVQTKMESYELQNIVCHIPGTDQKAGEIIFSAHLFEGIVKQGANDNKSGSAAILEVARVLHTLIEEGRLQRPKRTIRFLWGPEFSGTGPWVRKHKSLMEKTLCNINMDMVGEWLSKNNAFMQLIRTSYANPHYINDVVENYYRYVGEANRERVHNRHLFNKVLNRIVAPSGADEPFYYSIETHYGASDHEVFNNWAVHVPGVMMIAWPDQWYHTSGDRPDKADPTQLKRTAIIGAAVAYTIANADDDMAIKIAGEITSNATRRLGHKLVIGLERLNKATPEPFSDSYKMARNDMDKAIKNEKATLKSVLELADDKKMVEDYVNKMITTVDRIGKSHLEVIETHMKQTAKRLDTKPAEIRLTKLEKNAAKMVPKRTKKVKEHGYMGYRDVRQLINEVPEKKREKYPYSRWDISSIRELQNLIDGERSVLDIKNNLDAQYRRKSDLQSIINYFRLLELVGLVEM